MDDVDMDTHLVSNLVARISQLEIGLQQATADVQHAHNAAQQAEARAVAAEGAAVAQQPVSTPATRPLVDTRLLGKPKTFSGDNASWRNWRFIFQSYVAALSTQMRDLMDRATAAHADQECLNVNAGTTGQSLSSQLYYILVMSCEGPALRTLERAGDGEGALAWRWMVAEHEPNTAGRHATLLLEILAFSFTEDTRGSLDSLDLLITKYEQMTNDFLAEALKVALVQRSVRDPEIRSHLILHGARLNTYQTVREEVRNIMLTRASLATTPTPMDISALDKGKGKHGKGKGKGKKGKGDGKQPQHQQQQQQQHSKSDKAEKNDSDMVCFYCNKKGHRKADCRKRQRDQANSSSNSNSHRQWYS